MAQHLKQFKIVCSDLDGTLLSTKNDVSDFTVSIIQQIKDKVMIILVSARMPKSIQYLQQRMGIENHPTICYNGALIQHEGKTLYSETISGETLKGIAEISKSMGIKLGLYSDDDWFVSETSERVQKEIFNTKTYPIFENTEVTLSRWTSKKKGAHKIMLMGQEEVLDRVFSELETKFANQVHSYRSSDTIIEMSPKKASKLSAITSLLAPNETLDDILAFGDNYNDIEMIQKVGFGVAVGNARNEVKAVADAVTYANTEDGVAKFLHDRL
ncbi:HAD family hydrolase [Flagellimonas allohymeniacidonis]|uniref:HAD family phosphatase n=1 Tax=Flagellimonas allohymeniacidonis TaxID=2517819 RepID=A0A4Q8Q8P7_9FLAO|nr:HAD family hydrolase [Allomuricauda hymeniacidonis]TAI46605.1 HAD family phosphatase [Allomuricauda hymeniacidonis]